MMTLQIFDKAWSARGTYRNAPPHGITGDYYSSHALTPALTPPSAIAHALTLPLVVALVFLIAFVPTLTLTLALAHVFRAY
jgi:hypothetical protein